MKDQAALLTLAVQEIALVQERLRLVEERLGLLLDAQGGSPSGRFSLCTRCGLSYLTGRNHSCGDEVEA